MSYPHPYHFGGPARGTPPMNRQDVAAPGQGAVHLSVNVQPLHAYQYVPPANGPNGFHAEQHHAGHGAAVPHDRQYYTGIVRQGPYPPLSQEMRSWNAFDPAHNGGMVSYAPSNASTDGPMTSANPYQNIDPVLRPPEPSVRSSYSLSDVRDDDWDCESVEDSPDVSKANAYSPPTIADRAAYAMPENSTPCLSETPAIPLQLPTPSGNSPSEAPASPASSSPAPAPEMAPSAAPTRSRRTRKRAGASVPLTAANPNAVVRRRGAAARAAASPTSSVPEPSSSSAKAKGKGKGKGKKRARDDDAEAPASSAKRPRRAEPEASIALEASSSMAPVASSSTAPEVEPSTPTDVADVAATIERSPTPEGWVRCLWDGCETLLGKEASVVANHLRNAHFEDMGSGPFKCKWNRGCSQEMVVSSMVRHVTATHLSLQAHECLRCNKTFSREDSAVRHQRICSKCKSCGVQFDSKKKLKAHACPGSRAGPSGRK